VTGKRFNTRSGEEARRGARRVCAGAAAAEKEKRTAQRYAETWLGQAHSRICSNTRTHTRTHKHIHTRNAKELKDNLKPNDHEREGGT
jgi:hypothetical protein